MNFATTALPLQIDQEKVQILFHKVMTCRVTDKTERSFLQNAEIARELPFIVPFKKIEQRREKKEVNKIYRIEQQTKSTFPLQ
jgi:hypothetical protein